MGLTVVQAVRFEYHPSVGVDEGRCVERPVAMHAEEARGVDVGGLTVGGNHLAQGEGGVRVGDSLESGLNIDYDGRTLRTVVISASARIAPDPLPLNIAASL